MDSIELARQVAAELHMRATALGRNPWDSYAFAVAEATRRDVDVEPTADGAALLNGARATFLRRERLILHERAGSSFEQAFLIAHELGHIVLGDDQDGDPALEIDPPRSAEPSPIRQPSSRCTRPIDNVVTDLDQDGKDRMPRASN